MVKKYAWLTIVVVVVFGATLAFAPHNQWLGTALSLAAVLALVFVLMIPAVRRVAYRNKRATWIAGLAIIVAATVLLVVGLLSGVESSAELIATGFSVLLLLGLMLTQLPRISANVDRAIAAEKAVEKSTTSVKTFQPLSEVGRALEYTWKFRTTLFRVVGPWFLIFCLSYIGVESVALGAAHSRGDHNTALKSLLLLLILFLAAVCSLLISLMQWTRFIATDREPSWFKLPGRALWGWCWRCVIFGPIILRMINGANAWLQAQLPHASEWEILGLYKLASLIVLVFASPFALGLTAVSISEPNRATEARVVGFRQAGRKYYLGIAVVLLPYTLTSCIIDSIANIFPTVTWQITLAFFQITLFFATAVVAMTYITRTYRRGMLITGTIGA